MILNRKRSAKAAAVFVAASVQSLSCVDNAALSIGNIDFWVACWVKLTATGAGGTRVPLGKDSNSGNPREYVFYLVNGTAHWAVFDGVATQRADLTGTFNALAAGPWYFLMGYHDSVNALAGLSINAAPFQTQATTGAPGDGTAAFNIGNRTGGAAGACHDGSIAAAMVGKSPPGGIAGMATEIATRLYNNGRGRDPARLRAADRSRWGLVAGWNFADLAATTSDSIGANTLTNNNAATLGAGPG